MIVCSNCGAQCPDNAKFCSECGSKLYIKPVCPQCGNTDIHEGMKFCPECGCKLQAPAAKPVQNARPMPEQHAERERLRAQLRMFSPRRCLNNVQKMPLRMNKILPMPLQTALLRKMSMASLPE